MAFFAFAQRALTAATILARPSGDIFRFFVAIGIVLPFGLPGLRFSEVPLKRLLACWRRAISASSSAIICLVPIGEAYQRPRNEGLRRELNAPLALQSESRSTLLGENKYLFRLPISEIMRGPLGRKLIPHRTTLQKPSYRT